jgi:hypothetical protein
MQALRELRKLAIEVHTNESRSHRRKPEDGQWQIDTTLTSVCGWVKAADSQTAAPSH